MLSKAESVPNSPYLLTLINTSNPPIERKEALKYGENMIYSRCIVVISTLNYWLSDIVYP
uniref:Uncharacterized protein n=1 Tax=Arundo donax TaxID=35708 RepID=A0A0A9D3D3_ARUDO